VVVGTAIVVGAAAVVLVTRVVVVELALVLSLEDVSIASPLAQAETMRTRTAIKVARRPVMCGPFSGSTRDET
jgi:hypothetical protein